MLKSFLKDKMLIASKNRDYELAIKYRDYLFEIDNLFSKQIFNIKKVKKYHLISYSYSENTLVIAVFIVNDGLVIGRKHFIIDNYIILI